MQRIEKDVELALPPAAAQERWHEFAATKAELASAADVRFEDVGAERTRMRFAGESPNVEGTVEEFKQFAEKTWRARAGLSGSAAAGNPGARGVAPGGAGGAMPGSTGGTPAPGGGKPGTTPGTGPT
jgi:hypothetical protein